MIYDVDYFIKKFEAIPEEKWTTGVFYFNDACCAIGHCGVIGLANIYDPEPQALNKIIHFPTIYRINDGKHPHYKQKTPKRRILAALYDVKIKLNQGTGTSTERRNEVTSELHRADITKKLSQIEIVSETSDLKKQLC